MISLHSLGDQKIFPQGTNIISKFERIEVLNQRISDSIIVKINFPGRLYFISKISAEGMKWENDAAELQ